jgi:hypothetical protein
MTLVFLLSGIKVDAQRYSVDREPRKKVNLHISFKGMFKADPVKKENKKKERDRRKATREEAKLKKSYWKHLDHPKEISTNKRVYKRMKQNLRRAERQNDNKPKDGFFKRLSHKKIKLPKITTKKIRWPWTKKSSND